MRRPTPAAFARIARSFDPRGRSTRTDLLGFGFLLGCVGLLIGVGAILLGIDFNTQRQVERPLEVLVSLLWLLLFVRRLHDTGRSAAGLLVALPAMVNWGFEQSRRLVDGAIVVDRPWWLQAMLTASSLALLILLLWKGEEGLNRYGPDPRDGPPEETQLA